MTGINAKYEQLIGDLRRDFRPQREWGEGRGVFLVIGHFVVGVAGGTWLFALLFEYVPGLVAAFVLAGAGGVAHLAFLGRPERFWRMARQVKTAWVARGFWGLLLFLTGAVLYLPPLLVAAWPWSAASVIGAVGWLLAVAGMVVLIGYMGFVYTASKGIPFWNSALHPVLYMAYALRGGVAALLVAMAVLGAPSEEMPARLTTIWIGVTAVVIVLFALEIQGAFTRRQRRRPPLGAGDAGRARRRLLLRRHAAARAADSAGAGEREGGAVESGGAGGGRPAVGARRLLHEVHDHSCRHLSAARAASGPGQVSGV